MGVAYAAERGVALVVHGAVVDCLPPFLSFATIVASNSLPDCRMSQKRPHLRESEVEDRMYAHEPRPQAVSHLKRMQCRAVRIGASGSDEDRFASGMVVGEVEGEGIAEGDDFFGVRL